MTTLVSFSKAEKTAVFNMVDESEFVNIAVDNLAKYGVPLNPTMQATVSAMDSLMSRSALNKPATLHRLVAGELGEMAVGDEMTWAAYTPTSMGRAKYADAAGEPHITFVIKAPAGTHGVYVPEVLGKDQYHEREFTLARNTRAKVTKISEDRKTVTVQLMQGQGLKSGAPKPALSVAAKHAQHAVNFEDQRKGKVTPLKIEPEALAVALQAAGVKVTPDLKIRLRLRTMKGKDPQGFTSKIGPNEFRVVIEVKDKPAYEDKHLYVLNNSLIHEMRHVAQHQSDPTFSADYLAEMHKTGYTQNKYEAEARKFGHLADHTGTKPLAPGAKAVGKQGWAIQPAGNTVVTQSVPPKESLTGGSVLNATKWKQVGAQGGSNTGGYFEDENGKKFYVKKAADPNRASNEVLAASLYKEAGVASAEQMLVTTPFNGALGTASPVIPGAKQDLNLKLRDENYKAKLQEGFAVDAWLANWDVAGLVFDNVVSDAKGNPVRVDPGGALWYRAMASSGPKGAAFGDVVGELQTFKNTANTSGAIFGNITPERELESAKKVVAVSPERIDALVDAANFKDKSIATTMKARLKARREFIAKRYGLSLSEQRGLASRAKRDSQTSQRAMESRVERLRALVG